MLMMLAYEHHVLQGFLVLVPIEACAEAVEIDKGIKVYDRWMEGHPRGQELRVDGTARVMKPGMSL